MQAALDSISASVTHRPKVLGRSPLVSAPSLLPSSGSVTSLDPSRGNDGTDNITIQEATNRLG